MIEYIKWKQIKLLTQLSFFAPIPTTATSIDNPPNKKRELITTTLNWIQKADLD